MKMLNIVLFKLDHPGLQTSWPRWKTADCTSTATASRSTSYPRPRPSSTWRSTQTGIWSLRTEPLRSDSGQAIDHRWPWPWWRWPDNQRIRLMSIIVLTCVMFLKLAKLNQKWPSGQVAGVSPLALNLNFLSIFNCSMFRLSTFLASMTLE